jgi:NAD(P)-dependent dehydrogenase (short-subunit alcohol dehydrogenase family)
MLGGYLRMDCYPVYPYYSKKTMWKEEPVSFPPQHQPVQPGLEYVMNPLPIFENPAYRGSGKLAGRTAIISGGDSGIGRATAIAFAKEGAHLVIPYLYEERDAEETRARIEELGGSCVLMRVDLTAKKACQEVVDCAIATFGRLDILVNNIGVQYPQEKLTDITEEQLDYSSTKGAVVSFTRSLALNVVEQGIRVNAVAPGPIWTPLIPSSFSAARVSRFGTDTPMKRAGQPFELAPAYVYLASDDSRYVTGETLHVNGGDFITS